jgi:ADP-ribose pyrophosphatase YjhB (NUDIX family)
MSDSIPTAPAVGVGAVVFDPAGRVLLVRRGKPPQAGWWTVPGGRLEPGESLADACRREVREETGLEVEPGPIIAIAERQAEGFHYVIVDFAARLKPGQRLAPTPASDASDARWVDVAELAEYPLVEGLLAAIEAARAGLADGSGLGLHYADGAGRLFLPVM